MKKKIFILLVLVALVLCVFGCKKNDNVAETTVAVTENLNAPTQDNVEVGTENVVENYDEHLEKLIKIYEKQKIDVNNIKNPRQLGGYVTKDGKKVKNNMLYRGGDLSKIAEEDGKVLVEKYNIKEDVDMKGDFEIARGGDKEVEGLNYNHVPIINFPDDVYPKLKSIEPTIGDKSIDSMIAYYKVMGSLDAMYEGIVRDEYSQKGFRKFFDILLANDGGTFYHCSSGKDRTGFASVFILHILGVDRETILDDYEASCVYYLSDTGYAIQKMATANCDTQLINEIVKLMSVDRQVMANMLDIIDKEYGGLDSYLKNQIKLTDEEMQQLRDKYLE